MDFGLDLVIYTIFTLVTTTATFWRGMWKLAQADQAAWLLFQAAGIYLFREFVIIKVRCAAEGAGS